MISHRVFGFLEHRFGALWEGFDWTAKVWNFSSVAGLFYGAQQTNLCVSLQPSNKVVLLQMENFRQTASSRHTSGHITATRCVTNLARRDFSTGCRHEARA
jgi:hypothetical protein